MMNVDKFTVKFNINKFFVKYNENSCAKVDRNSCAKSAFTENRTRIYRL